MNIKKDTLPQKKQDVDILGLKTSVSLLETQLSVLFFKRAQLHQVLHEFRTQYINEVGEIVNELLEIRMKLLFDDKDSNPDKGNEYKDAKKDFEEFNKRYQNLKDTFQHKLSEEDKKLLQKLFRKASKKCHPDIISDEMKEQASKIFVELNDAYFQNDLEKVKQIAEMLDNNIYNFAKVTEIVSERRKLENIIKKLEADVKELKKEIFDIEHSEAYMTLKDLDSWDNYFINIKQKLSNELEQIKLQYEQR